MTAITAPIEDGAIIRKQQRRVNRARNFPINTDPCSRHLHIMADALASKRYGHQYPMLQEEPLHCAITMYAVLEALWKARTELARLKAKYE